MSSKAPIRSVWDDLADSPEEAASLKAKSGMLIAIGETVKAWELTQSAAADRLKITQPRLNDLLKGRIERFSLDALFDLAERVGLAPTIELRAAA